MPDKRAFGRMALYGNVKVDGLAEKSEPLNSELNNIGYGGFCISTPEIIQPGTTIDFQLITHAAYQPLTGKGMVKYFIDPAPGRMHRYKTGVEFIETNKNMVTHILNKLQDEISISIMSKSKIKPIDYIPF